MARDESVFDEFWNEQPNLMGRGLDIAQAVEVLAKAHHYDEAMCEKITTVLEHIEPILITDSIDDLNVLRREFDADFLYDFKSGLAFVEIFGKHEILGDYLMDSIDRGKARPGACDEYIELGHGCFKSSVGSKIMIGAGVKKPGIVGPYEYL